MFPNFKILCFYFTVITYSIYLLFYKNISYNYYLSLVLYIKIFKYFPSVIFLFLDLIFTVKCPLISYKIERLYLLTLYLKNACIKQKKKKKNSLDIFSWEICRKFSAAAAAKSFESCPTLCDSIDGSPPGSPVPGILQAWTLEWVAISFSNAWKWKVNVKSFYSCPTLSDPMDCSLPGSSVHGILQASVLEWVSYCGLRC